MSELVLNVTANAAGLVEIDKVLTRLELLLNKPTSVNLESLNAQVAKLEKEAATTTTTVARLEAELGGLAKTGTAAAQGATKAGASFEKAGADAADAEKSVNLLTASYSTLVKAMRDADGSFVFTTAAMEKQAAEATVLQAQMASLTTAQRATMSQQQALAGVTAAVNKEYATLVELDTSILAVNDPLIAQVRAEVAAKAELALAQGAITEARYAELTGVILLTEAEIELTTAQKAAAGVVSLRDKEKATQLELQTAMLAVDDAKLLQDKKITVEMAKQAFLQGAITEARYHAIAGIEKQTVAIAQETVAMKGATTAAHNLNGAMRGAAGASGTLWLSYGAIAPLLATFAAVSGTLKGYKEALNFESAVQYMVALGKATGDTTATIEGLRAGLLSIKGVAHGPNDLAVALKALTKAGFSASESVGELKTLSHLATVAEEDLATTTTAVISQFRAWSVESVGAARGVRTMSEAANVLAAAALTTTLDVGELSKMMKYTPVLATQTAATFTEVTAALGTMSNMGVRGTTAATSLRTAMLQLQSPTSKTRSMLKDLGLQVELFTDDGKLKSMSGMFDALATSLKGVADKDRVTLLKSMFSIRAGSAGAIMLQQFNQAIKDGTFSFKEQVEMLEKVKREGRFINDMYAEMEKTTQTLWDETKASMARAALEGLDTEPIKEFVTTLKDFAESGALTTIARGIGLIGDSLVDLAKHNLALRSMAFGLSLLSTSATVLKDKMDSAKAGVEGLAPATLVMLNAKDLLNKANQEGYKYTNAEGMAVARLTDAYGSLGKAYVATEFDGKIQASALKVKTLVEEQQSFFKNMKTAGETPENLAVYTRMTKEVEEARAAHTKLVKDRATAAAAPMQWMQRVDSRADIAARKKAGAETTAEILKQSQNRRDVEMQATELAHADRAADYKFQLEMLKKKGAAELNSAIDVMTQKKVINDQVLSNDLDLLQKQLGLAKEKHGEAVTNASSPTATDGAFKAALEAEKKVQLLENKVKQKKLEQRRSDERFAKDLNLKLLDRQREYNETSLKLAARKAAREKTVTLESISREAELLDAARAAKLVSEEEYLSKSRELKFDALDAEESALSAQLDHLKAKRASAIDTPGAKKTDKNIREMGDAIEAVEVALDGVAKKKGALHGLIATEDLASAREFSEVLKDIRKASTDRTSEANFELGIRSRGDKEQELARTRRGFQLEKEEKIAALVKEEGATTAVFRKIERLTAEYAAVDAAAVSSYDAQMAASQDFFGGLEKGMNDYIEGSQDVFGQTADMVGKAFGSMEDALVQFVTTGKLNFKDLANSIIADMIRISVRQSITGPLAGMATSFIGGLISPSMTVSGTGGIPNTWSPIGRNANGNAFGPNGMIKAFASGGIVDSPTVFPFSKGVGLMGEAGPEGILPLKRVNGRLGVEASGGNSSPTVVINQNLDLRGATESAVPQMQGAASQIADQVYQRVRGSFTRGGELYNLSRG